MKALTFKSGTLAISERDIPQIHDESLVKVTLSGICNTDIEITRGYSGFDGTLGHEFVGIVETSNQEHLVGRRVVGDINSGCGTCQLCLSGDPRHCSSRTVLGIVSREGCHAEYVSLPAANLVVVPDDVPDSRAVFAEPLAAAIAISERLEILDGDRIAVVGDGKLGILCAIAMTRLSGSTILVGKHESKMTVAASLGVDCMPLDEAVAKGRIFDIVVEASGSQSGFNTAMSLVRPRGAIVLKSTYQGSPVWEAWKVVVDEISIIGSRCGRLETAIRFLSASGIEVERLVSEIFSLSEGVAAMHRAQEKGVLKILLDPK